MKPGDSSRPTVPLAGDHAASLEAFQRLFDPAYPVVGTVAVRDSVARKATP